ncbi:hypothetical protein [Lacticaseibacillus suibinensis]|uniref:hypothetical protein n=1 Tax=Lacticaseibacillus suibinensis TaxID=2486011 RepID=UPI000F7B62D2|nr:hypothetical protein [Lacticaseibacillus suibinensis]
MDWSKWISAIALVISFLALSVPLYRSRQSAKIKEIITIPTLENATWAYVVVANYSTTSLSIYGATLNGVRLYRHKHYFADRPDEGKQYSSEFPVKIAPQSSDGLLLEFVNREKVAFDRTAEIELVLFGNSGNVKANLVINQSKLTPEIALREI